MAASIAVPLLILATKVALGGRKVLDDSKVDRQPTFQGLELELHRYPGARVLRVVHPGAQNIGEHRHEWSYIGLYTAGRYRELYDGGEADMAGPCVAFHPARRPHSDVIAADGLETLTIEFDAAWLRQHGFDRRIDQSCIWRGGAVGGAARGLARIVSTPCSERQLGEATCRFLHLALSAEPPPIPSWLPSVRRALDDEVPSTLALARSLDLHPAWLARAYRAATSEGLAETVRRRRVERASLMLRRSTLSLAEVAIGAGFCDQSHMNRGFRAVLGRTPLAVRNECPV